MTTTTSEQIDYSGCYTLDDHLAEWWEGTSWEEVLDGWTLAGRDECGCDTWTRPHAPGESVTPKSLTAHDRGCSRPRTDPRHPAAHVWSDHVDDDLLDMTQRFGRTLSAFAVFTALQHAGDFAEACRAVGMPSSCAQDLTELGTDFDDSDEDTAVLAAQYADHLDEVAEQAQAELDEAQTARDDLDDEDAGTAPGGFSDDELAEQKRERDERVAEAAEKAEKAQVEARDAREKAEKAAVSGRERALQRKRDNEWADDQLRREKAEAQADRVRETYGADAFTFVDLAEDVEGDDEDDKPLLTRSDGAPWIMPGTVNSIHGPSGIGKSWIALWSAALALHAGLNVLYLDHESDAKKVRRRLKRTLGLTSDELAGHFGYWRVRFDLAARTDEWNAALDARSWDLIVIDGVTRSYMLGDYDTDDADDTNKWFDAIPHHAQARTATKHGGDGASVLLVDHVTKAETGTPKAFPAGSNAKRANITGVVASIVPGSKPLTPGAKGDLRVWLSKDRDGESLAHTTDTKGEVSLFGVFAMDTTSPDAPAKVSFDPPEGATDVADEPGDPTDQGVTDFDVFLSTRLTYLGKAPSRPQVAFAIALALGGDEGMTKNEQTVEVARQCPRFIDTRQRTGAVTQARKQMTPGKGTRLVADPDSKYANDPAVQAIVRYFEGQE